MSQADFFAGAECELAPRARRGDPATSHGAAAAATSLSGDHHMLILASLQRGAAGADGIAARCRLSGHQVLKRMAELERIDRKSVV